MRLAGYARVSIEKNVEDLEGQVAAIQKWADWQGFDLEIVEEVGSAAGGADRPVFDALLDRIVDGEYEGLVVQRLDRFGRSLSHILVTVDRLETAGKHFYAFENQLHLKPDGKDPMSQMFFHILGAFAEFERELLMQRLAMGREAARARGKHLGRPPRKLPIKDIHRMRKRGASLKFLGKMFSMSPEWIGIHLRRYEAKEYPYGPKKIPNG